MRMHQGRPVILFKGDRVDERRGAAGGQELRVAEDEGDAELARTTASTTTAT